MSAKPCIECKRRPKALPRQRCVTCQLRIEPIGVQVAASRARLALVPEPLRVKRSKAVLAQAPAGTTWCAGCQSFRDLLDFADGATKCRPCASAVAHASMIEKTYKLTSAEYDALLEAQGGKCAICRARPRTKRLAVDHDHKSNAVRGLLCSRCNHDLMGSAWDSIALVSALWHYLNTPPSTGAWSPPESAARIGVVGDAQRPSNATASSPLVTNHSGKKKPGAPDEASTAAECERPHYLPAGWSAVTGKSGVYWIEDRPDVDAPF